MSGTAKLIGIVVTIAGVVSAIAMVGHMVDVLTVFNQGITVAQNGGDTTPYIEALVIILVAALIPGWILAIAD